MEVVCDLEVFGHLSPAEKQGHLVVCNKSELQHCCPNVLIPLAATLALDTHLSVHHCTHQQRCCDVTQTAAVSGEASVAAASAGGAAPVGWRSGSRRMRPRSR